MKHICRTGFAGRRPIEDYPLSNRFDEVDTLLIFDNVEIPWENVLFYRHTRAAAYIRSTLHRYSAFPYTQRVMKIADMLIGVALFNARQTGLEKQQAVQEKLAELACFREGINAHLTAAIAAAEPTQAVADAGISRCSIPEESLLRRSFRQSLAHRKRTRRWADLRHAGLRDLSES